MSQIGTNRTYRAGLSMSVDRGGTENICSGRVFRILTHFRQSPPASRVDDRMVAVPIRPT